MITFSFHSLTLFAFIAASAFLLDRYFGDPQWWPHPVRLIGQAIDKIRSALPHTLGNKALFAAGTFATLLIASSTAIIVDRLGALPFIGLLASVYFGYAGLALRCLMEEGQKTIDLIDSGDLNAARAQLAMLVSRDTSQMNADELRRSLAETLSENLSDGFVAPYVYLLVFGPAGMWFYKAVNTFDSMWGYRTNELEYLGKFAAKLDDVLNYIPARLTALLLLAADSMQNSHEHGLFTRTAHDARKMESPNAGWPMAMCAHLAGAQMGGPTIYFDKIKHKPILGAAGIPWTRERIQYLMALLSRTGWLLFGATIAWGLLALIISMIQ